MAHNSIHYCARRFYHARPPPNRRFGSIHVDIVGPLPTSESKTYLFTIVDRFTRWPEVIPMEDSATETCARALIRHWIARFGVPDDLTSDRGPQFTSHLWADLSCWASPRPPPQLTTPRPMGWWSAYTGSSRHR